MRFIRKPTLKPPRLVRAGKTSGSSASAASGQGSPRWSRRRSARRLRRRCAPPDIPFAGSWPLRRSLPPTCWRDRRRGSRLSTRGPACRAARSARWRISLKTTGPRPSASTFSPAMRATSARRQARAIGRAGRRLRAISLTSTRSCCERRDPAHRLESWVAELVGEPKEPLEDISGGAWRRRLFAHEAEWSPAHVQQERRKFILRTEAGSWLLKFVGLGREGARKLDRARVLHSAGFAPEVAGYRHGFLIERWIEKARPLHLKAVDRGGLITFAGRYLGFRARTFGAGPEHGASLDQLLQMARINTAQALGEAWARRLDRSAPDLRKLERRVRRMETDSRLHVWEWLQRDDGRLLKTDALDHHAAHDLVGCQDVAWDVAGAMVELDLSPTEM